MADFLTILVTKGRKGANQSSAATVAIPVTGDRFDVTGTTGITSITTGSREVGSRFYLRFTGALTITHSSSLQLQDASNITTMAGDVILFEVTDTNKVRQVTLYGSAGAAGADGADGSVWRNGSGTPSNATGADGDYYLDDDAGNVYQRSSGTYSQVANIKGPTGATGAKGDAGADGADGSDFEISDTPTAAEAISAKDIVYYKSDGEIAKADATDGTKPAMAWADASISSSASGKVFFVGIMIGQSGLTIGGACYLDTTAGGITQTPPSTSGNAVQQVGVAISASKVLFNPQAAIIV